MNPCAILLALATLHPGATREHETFTPGAAVACERVEVGVHRNSMGRVSLYGAARVPLHGSARLLLGAVTGYTAAPVLPAIALSIDIGRINLVLVPPASVQKASTDLAIAVRWQLP